MKIIELDASIDQFCNDLIKSAGAEERAQELKQLLLDIKKLVTALEYKYDPQRNSGIIKSFFARWHLESVKELIEDYV